MATVMLVVVISGAAAGNVWAWVCQLRLAFVEDDFLSVSCSKSPNYAMGCQCQTASFCLSRTYGGVVYIVDLWTGYQQCTIRSFLFRKLSIGKFELQVSFSLGSFVLDKIFEMHFRFLLYIWVWVDCRPISLQIYRRTSSNVDQDGDNHHGWNCCCKRW